MVLSPAGTLTHSPSPGLSYLPHGPPRGGAAHTNPLPAPPWPPHPPQPEPGCHPGDSSGGASECPPGRHGEEAAAGTCPSPEDPPRSPSSTHRPQGPASGDLGAGTAEGPWMLRQPPSAPCCSRSQLQPLRWMVLGCRPGGQVPVLPPHPWPPPPPAPGEGRSQAARAPRGCQAAAGERRDPGAAARARAPGVSAQGALGAKA